MCADLLLSLREAFDGATVPLDVPVRRTCAASGGRRESWLEPCAGCAGTGARFRFTIAAPCTSSTLVDVRVAIR